MKKFRTVISVMIMMLAAIAGIFAGAALGSAMGGAILFSMIAGFGCLIYVLDSRES